MLEELQQLLKESSIKNSQIELPDNIEGHPILTPAECEEGDLVTIWFITPDQIQDEYNIDDTFKRVTAQSIFIFNYAEGNTIYGWKGNFRGFAKSMDTDTDKQKKSAISQYSKYLASGGQTNLPVIITSTYNPNLNPILLITPAETIVDYLNRSDLTIYDMVMQDGSWIGPRANSNVWQMVPRCSNPIIYKMMNSPEAKEQNIFHELIFDYTRKQKRHYSEPNTFSPNRRVRPHFIYRDVRKPDNEYILTMDMQNAVGQWRSFLITDMEWGERMQNIRLGAPFKFTTANILHSLKKELGTINKKLVSKVEDVDEQESIFSDYNLYNAMKLYYKHLKKNNGKIDKENSAIFLPNIIKKD